jgi:cephalosporin hydroxylase
MLKIDMEQGQVIQETTDATGQCIEQRFPMGSPEAFHLVSDAWLRCGWDNKYVYSFTWLGRPLIQLPDDVLRIQEVLFTVKPDVIIETGIAHGGSLIFYASLCQAMGKGRVIGVDIEIRPHNRSAIETHPLFPYITLIEADSAAPSTIKQVSSLVKPGETVMVLLDSCHTKAHVLKELDAYSPLVTPGSYIVAMDGIMGQLGNAPRTNPDWSWDNPSNAALAFVEDHPEFVIESPGYLFNEGTVRDHVTYWPNAWIKKTH